MRPHHKILMREQLEDSLGKIAKLKELQRPRKGWLRAIRESLGMTGKQFAGRLRVAPPRINALEKNEVSGSVTIKSMQQAAEALDCVFVYAVIPKTTLEETVVARAKTLALKRLQRVSHSMLLEQQDLPESEQQGMIDAEVSEILREMPKELWEDHGGV